MGNQGGKALKWLPAHFNFYIFKHSKIRKRAAKHFDNGEQPGEAVTAAMFQAMRDALAEQKQKPLSIDDVTAMIAGQIGQLAPMDEETADLFQRLVKKMIEQAEK